MSSPYCGPPHARSRQEEHTICTAVGPGAVATVRRYGDTSPLHDPGLVRNSAQEQRRSCRSALQTTPKPTIVSPGFNITLSDEEGQGERAQCRRYTGDRRSPKPFGRITQDIRVIIARFFDPICGNDHPYISRQVRAPGSLALSPAALVSGRFCADHSYGRCNLGVMIG